MDSSENSNEKELQETSNSSMKVPKLTLEAKIFALQEEITKVESTYAVLLDQQKNSWRANSQGHKSF
jgi:hypothetical protein